MDDMEHPSIFLTDYRSAWSQVRSKNQQIQLKRRWLLGVSLSETDQKKLKRDNILETRSLDESLIREDDVFFHTVKSRVEEAFGIRPGAVVLDDLDSPIMPGIAKVVLSHLERLNTNGLCLLAEILVGSGTEFEKTRKKIQRVVKEALPVVFGTRNPDDSGDVKEISRKINKIFNDPRNFRGRCVPFLTPRIMIQRANVKMVLEELGNFPCQTLVAMHWKLKDVKQAMPQLQPKKCGFNRDYLIKVVKKNCLKMLDELGKEDRLPMPIAKAMEVAYLSHELEPWFHSYSVTEFRKVSPRLETLQSELIKAIWLVKTKVGLPVLEKVKSLLDPKAEVLTRSLRSAIRKVLTEYLFWCSDMDPVPNTLYQILAAINTNNRSTIVNAFNIKNVVDEEIELVLNVSAHTKQNLLDLLPANDFSEDFTDAYMEDLKDSDDEFDNVEENRDSDDVMSLSGDDISQCSSSCGSADSVPLDSTPSLALNDAEKKFLEISNERLKSGVFVDRVESVVKQTTYTNKYLAIQEVCDETSMVMYSHIGRLLEEFGRKEGWDFDGCRSLSPERDCANEKGHSQEQHQGEESDDMTMIRVTEELMPSFPKSGIDKLRKLLGS